MACNVEYPGEYCCKIGLTVDDFQSTNARGPKITNITRGIIYELSCVKKKTSIPWIIFYERVQLLCDSTFNVSFPSFKVMVGRLEKKKAELTRNKKHRELDDLLSEPFCSVAQPNPTRGTPPLTQTGKDLAKEIKKNEELCSKLSELSVRNVNKRIKRREAKFADSQEQVKVMGQEIATQSKTITKLESRLQSAHASTHALRQRVYRSNAKTEETSMQKCEFDSEISELERKFFSKVNELEQRIEVLITEVDIARHERDILSERLDEVKNNTIRTKQGQKFLDGVRQCCIELLSMNVATKQVEPVIRAVLRNIASIEVGPLPKPSTLSGMLAEMKCLAYQQVSDEISSEECVTLHSDGTSKFGQHYESYQISTEKSVLPGLVRNADWIC